MDFTGDRVVINVSGSRYETFLSTLERFPNTLLGCSSKRKVYFDSSRHEYFFNRNRKTFDAILFYYQSYGRLSKPPNIPERYFMNELSFFEIGKEHLTFADRVDRTLLGDSLQAPENKLQRFIWRLFSGLHSSLDVQCVTLIGISTLILSIIISCVESLPFLEQPRTEKHKLMTRALKILNHVCYAWFTIELTLRFAGTVNKIKFFKSVLNIIDIAAVIPYYLQLVIFSNTKTAALSMLRVFRLFRIARLLKFSRYSRGIRALLFTFYASRHELILLCFLVLIATVVSGALTYYAEINDENSFMTSIPQSLWWSINTITTVGYGDTYPVTTVGKALGGFFSMIGTILIGLPIFCLVSNFLELWDSIKEKSVEIKDQKSAEFQRTINTSVEDSETRL